MVTHPQAVSEFLAGKTIAIVGVSRSSRKGVGHFLMKKFKDAGYRVFLVNPSAGEIEGLRCYANLTQLPEKPDGVLIVTHPKQTPAVVLECAELGLKRVWIHHTFGQGSYSKEAEELCRSRGIVAITGGCPAMHLNPDVGHRCFRTLFGLFGKLTVVG